MPAADVAHRPGDGAQAPRDVAHAVAAALRDLGLQRVYGLPGEDHLRLLDALASAGLQYVAARDETAAALMAATEAQARRLPGVVVLTLAPGLTNAINGLAHAYLDHIPLLVIAGQHHPERAPVLVRQQLDNHQLVAAVTRWSTTASAHIHQVLGKAIEVALAPPGGPVLLELRDDVASAAPADAAADWPALQTQARTTRLHSGPLQPGLERITSMLASARRPALIVGGCRTDPQLPAAIRTLATTGRVPVFTTPSALGTLHEQEPWFAGTFLNGNLEAAILDRSDVIVSIDLDARDFFNTAWRYSATLVGLNTLPDTQRFVPLRYQVVGDPTEALAALAGALDQTASEWTTDAVAGYRAHVLEHFHLHDARLTLASAVCDARSVLPSETLVSVDAGFGKPLTSYLWSAPAANMYFTAHGLSTMGYALPAATALKLCYPERPVVAFMGDGSLLMRASEMTVAAACGVAPVYVAWMDASLSQIELKQRRQHLQPVGAGVPDVQCARVADAFGGIGVDVHSRQEFRAALEAAVQRSVPTLIGARVDQTRRGAWFELIRG